MSIAVHAVAEPAIAQLAVEAILAKTPPKRRIQAVPDSRLVAEAR